MTFQTEPPFKARSEFLRVLQQRGFIHQCTDMAALDERLCCGRVVAYNGFDLTADSLHAGHLIPIMMLRWLQRTGHKPIVVMGGGTTRIGDPSFRDSTRPLLADDEIAHNLAGIRHVFETFLAFGEGPTDAVMLNNDDWLRDLRFLDFLREIGPHFSINRMLSFDSVKLRLERDQSLSLLEFNYMVIQAFDFLHLGRSRDCTLQMGASDQWGNIINGIELGRRIDGRPLFGLTAPLLTTASGAKMGKSASGAIWLNAEKLSPYDFWQFWRNTEDADVGRFLRLFTELPIAEIERLEQLGGSEINEAKKVLADAVTTLCHGSSAAHKAHVTAREVFEQGAALGDLPRVSLEAEELRRGVQVVEVMVRAGFAKSRNDARRLISGGGVRIGDVVVEDTAAAVLERAMQGGEIMMLSVGRKRHVIVSLAE